MTGSRTANKSEWEEIKQSDFKFQNAIWKANLVPEEFYSVFYAIYNYYIFSIIDNL